MNVKEFNETHWKIGMECMYQTFVYDIRGVSFHHGTIMIERAMQDEWIRFEDIELISPTKTE